jgi:hypothetical protein
MVILVVLIMSAVVFWPTSQKHHLLAYLPDDVAFYYHWTNKKTFKQDFFGQSKPQEMILDLENILDDNFLNLQEIIWFRTDKEVGGDYLLRFSRLPKSFLEKFDSKEWKYKAVIVEKNVLLLDSDPFVENIEVDLEKSKYFEDGLSVYWQKNQAPEFLQNLSSLVESVFVGEEVLLNLQELKKGKNKLSLLENRNSETKDIANFLAPENFDLAFGFNNSMPLELTSDISSKLLKIFFDSLPYYNLSKEVIENRILTDTMLWQKDDAWILASDKEWQEDILDFIDYFVVEEVPGVLKDGTAYVELIASPNQTITEHNINGQIVAQIEDLFIWDIGDQHYLSNQKSLIEDLSSNNRYIADIFNNCVDKELKLGDFLYIKDKTISEQITASYIADYDVEDLQMVSYATGTISGLNICF